MGEEGEEREEKGKRNEGDKIGEGIGKREGSSSTIIFII